jgi:hypothetical protein
MMVLAPALEVSAQDKPKIEVVPQIGHSMIVWSVAFSPDARQVLSGGRGQHAQAVGYGQRHPAAHRRWRSHPTGGRCCRAAMTRR